MKESNDVLESQRWKPSLWNRVLLITTFLVIIVLAGGVVVVRYLGERKLHEQARVAESRFVDIQRQDIGLFAVPLAWAVRKELIKQNYDQIDEYFNQLIKRKVFGLIMLVDPSGTITVSTDRKFQGRSFSSRYPGLKLNAAGAVSYKVQEGKSLYLIPVMGLNERIGTIVFLYSYRQFLPQ
ncbi:MAG: hypothetical protein WCK32_02180 [Chlorobiaceae bacterium]